ncbi:MAG: type II secretion system F family protein [Pasteurella oralis]|uniref:type II secretion system F family protein n=1 Tax=Pasteurella oralis TaxID=1071947 RepID=UPI000C7B4EA8|nr:type II secretion system F family protein [Pasteurella oralis]MDO5054984.1 type II secretion system F family protein [Pasteurella oralis]
MSKLKLFRWRGINRLKQTQKGMIVAETEAIAKQRLITRGFQQLRLQQDWQLSTKPKNSEICELWSQFAFLLQSALPLKTSLQILQQNCLNIQLNQWVVNLLKSLENGISLSVALQHAGNHVTTQERQLIYIGEMTGKLPQICQQIAEQRKKALALQRRVQKILFYPVVVLSISVILTTLLLLFVVPQFAEIYAEQPLPVFTSLLLSLSMGLQRYFLQIILILSLLILLIHLQLKYSLWLNRQKVKLIQRIPYLNKITQLNRLVHFCRHLHLMLAAGVPLTQALDCFLPKQQSWQRETTLQYDFVLVNEVRSVLQQISYGNTFSDSISTTLFPDSVQQMLQVGEKSGKFVAMLDYIADNYQQQLEHQLDLLAQMLEPLLMLLIGSLIGLIMLGMYLPIFSMGAVMQ